MSGRLRTLAITLITASAIASMAVRTPWAALRVVAFSRGAVYVDQGDVARQRSNRDCGVAALAMILEHYGRGGNSLDSLVALTEQRQRGLSFAELQRVAAAFSLSAHGWIVPARQLGAIATPAIVHFPNHYVVLDSVRQGWAYLRDPAIGRVRMTLGMLAWRSTRRVLVFTVMTTLREPAAPFNIAASQSGVTPRVLAAVVRISPRASMENGNSNRNGNSNFRLRSCADSADCAD